MNSNTMVNWVRAMVAGMPHGGKKKAAEMLGISPSGLSKLVNNPDRGFDEKTLRAVAWVETSKAEKFPVEQYPIVVEQRVGPIVVETRRGAGGEEFYCWRVAK